MRTPATALAALLLGFPLLAPASAGIYDNTVSTCDTVNCSSLTLPATYVVAEPYVTQVYATKGQCLRLDVTVQAVDLEMVLVSPNGKSWRNDDRVNGDTRPLIRATANVTGWYLLQVGYYSGAGTTGDFTLRYGRYRSGNANCAATSTRAPNDDVDHPLVYEAK